MTTATPVTVLVPVYKGLDEVRACLESVVRHAAGARNDLELLVIDDASPDPAMRSLLERTAEEVAQAAGPLKVRVLHNEENLGFVKTVNRGLADSSGDVVLLNADTVVTNGWLDRLVEVAASRPDVASVTPLTNFGSICTLPRSIIDAFALDGPTPLIDACGAHVTESSLRLAPEIIVGVGFCMYVTRDAIDRCGLLDEEAFGRGYGEEVDFCLRATAQGMYHLADDSTFVYHHGAVSFGGEREESLVRSSALIHDRYPHFREANIRERSEDPLRATFTALELALHPPRQDRPHVLQILHSPPNDVGGTEKHLRALIDALVGEFDFSILYPDHGGFVLRTIWSGEGVSCSERELLLAAGPEQPDAIEDPTAADAVRTALDLFDFDAVHVQNLIGHSASPLAVLADFPGPVVCSVRDLYLACPQFTLLYRNERACGIPEDLSVCGRCLPETRGMTIDRLEEFRATVARRLDAVDHWIFASQSAADYFARVYDVDASRRHVIPHGAIVDPAIGREPDESAVFDEPLRLAFVGIGWLRKGLSVVNEIAEHFRGSNVELHHFGTLKEPASSALRLHGPYDNAMLPTLLERAGVHVILLPGPYAETFGHVMTEAIAAGRPVIGARYGALAERIRLTGAGWTVDPEDPAGIIELIEHLDCCRDEVLAATRRAAEVQIPSVAETSGAYAALYRSMQGSGEPTGDRQGALQ